jgi:O-antigen ligase
MLVPVWFALLMALLVSFVPLQPNPIPIVVGVLVIAIVGVTANMVRANRRLETAIQLILQDAGI